MAESKEEEENKEKTPKKDEKSQEKSTNSGFSNEKLLLFAGIPGVVLLAIVVQYAYHTYYVLPLRERTLLPKVEFPIERKPWRIVRPETAFSLGSKHSTGVILSLGFGVGNKTEVSLLSDWPENRWIESDGHSFGSRFLQDNSTSIEIKFLMDPNGFRIKINANKLHHVQASERQLHLFLFNKNTLVPFGTTTGFSDDTGNFSVRVSGEPQNVEGSTMTFKFTESLEFEFLLYTNEENEENFEELYKERSQLHDSEFVKKFNLENLPAFYQSMARSAHALLLTSSRHIDGKLTATGKRNPLFETSDIELDYINVASEDQLMNFDDQSLALLVLNDPDVAVQLLSSWLNLMNEDKDLPYFISFNSPNLDYSQRRNAVLTFYVLGKILDQVKEDQLKLLYPQIEALASTVVNDVKQLRNGQYSWRSSPPSISEFPRPNVDQANQFNIDLYCWLFHLSRTVTKLASSFGTVEEQKKWADFSENFNDDQLLQYFDSKTNRFSDRYLEQSGNKEVLFFDIGSGYLSLFPFMFKLLKPASEELKHSVEQIANEELFSPFGIRSLSKNSKYFSETSGEISIAVNYFILDALKYYSGISGPAQDLAHSTYARLRAVIIAQVAREFKRSGIFWEKYSDVDGSGRGRRNHAWTTLVLNILTDRF